MTNVRFLANERYLVSLGGDDCWYVRINVENGLVIQCSLILVSFYGNVLLQPIMKTKIDMCALVLFDVVLVTCSDLFF